MRARYIKPGFCSSENLAECSREARLLAALLPMLADRSGRLEDRPKKIKALLFPYDDDINSTTVDGWLGELSEANFISRYLVEELQVIQIITFKEHQAPHPNEKQSAFPEQSVTSHVITRQEHTKECTPHSRSIYCDQVRVKDLDLKEGGLGETNPPPEEKPPSPILAGCEFVRCSPEELEKVKTYYQKHSLPLDLLPFVIPEVDKWLAKDSPEAKKARKNATHYRRLYDTWALTKAREAQKARAVPRLTNTEKAEQLAARVRLASQNGITSISEILPKIGAKYGT